MKKIDYNSQAAEIIFEYIKDIDTGNPARLGNLRHRAIDWFIRYSISHKSYSHDDKILEKYKYLFTSVGKSTLRG